MMKKSITQSFIKCGVILSLFGCSQAPQKINYGHDQCDYCKMNIVDERFGSETVTKQGKSYKFDSIECLVAFLVNGAIESQDLGSHWVTCADSPGALRSVTEVYFAVTDSLRSPMGANVVAYTTEADRAAAIERFGGSEISWQDLQSHLKETGFIR